MITFPTQCLGVEATGNQELCFKYDMFYEANDVCMLTMICLTRLGNLTCLTIPQQIEDDLREYGSATMIQICTRLHSSSVTDDAKHDCRHTELDYKMVSLWCRMCLKFSTPRVLEFCRFGAISSTHRISLRSLSSIPILDSESQVV